MQATARQLAWYIERDGGVVSCQADGSQVVRVPLMGGHITYHVPASGFPFGVDDLNAERDIVYRQIQDRRRKAAAR